MHRFIWLFPVLYLPALAAQQALANNQTGKLAFLVPDLLNSAVQNLDPRLRPVLNRAISPRFASVNTGVASALSNLPIPSSASGVNYSYDKQLGMYVPSPQSLGPILTERAETIGKNKFFFGLWFQRFHFDRLDDLDFRNFSVGIPLEIPAGSSFSIPGLVTANTFISLSISQTTAHVSYGLTHRIDVSYAFPIVTSSMLIRTEGAVRSLLQQETLASSSISGSSTGLGDGIIRLKTRVLGNSKAKLALITDFRLPTGDEFNYHGAGAFGIKPFLAASYAGGAISPHINVGYQWNGQSFLASPSAQEKRRLPGQAFYAAGVDASVTPRFTVSADVLDQIIIHGERSLLRPATAVDGSSYNALIFGNETHHEANASAGFKTRVASDLVVTCNLVFRLNKSGLRARIVPLVGVSYVF